MSLRTIAVGRAPAGSTVEVHVNAAPDKWITQTANVDGYASFVWDSSLTDSDIRITAVGYKPYLQHVTWKPVNHQVNIGVDLPALTPLSLPLPHLEIRGQDFVDDKGARQVFNGVDAFCAFDRYLDGIDLSPWFTEARDFSFNLWRVFLMGSKAQNGVLELRPSDAGYWQKLRPFADLVNSHGILLLATVFVDAQDIMTNSSARQQHWINVANALRGSGTLLSGGNEWHKNGFDPGELSDPAMLWSRGSDLGDSAPYRPYGSFAEFHPRRDMPTSVMDTVASPVFIHGTNGLTGPLVIDEPPKFGTNGSGGDFDQPFTAYRFARHYATECGAAVFHNYFNQRGLVMDAHTRDCAAAWTQGMKL